MRGAVLVAGVVSTMRARCPPLAISQIEGLKLKGEGPKHDISESGNSITAIT